MIEETLTTSTRLKAKWLATNPRERALVLVAAALVLLSLVWWTLIAPPLRVLRQASDQQRVLDADWQKMQGLQAQAQRMQALPKTSQDEALRELQALTQRLGASAQLEVSADRVTLTVRAIPADALAQWLAQVRTTAHVQPAEVRLRRADSPVAGWDGVLVLGLAAR